MGRQLSRMHRLQFPFCRAKRAENNLIVYAGRRSKEIQLAREEWKFSIHCAVQRRKDLGGDKDVFLSHSGKQKNFVRQLYRDLLRENVSCFFDEELPLAENFPSLIFEAVETSKIAVVVLSKEFIRSKWPMLELSAFIGAMNSGKNANLKLLPIFFMINPKELSQLTKESSEWQKLEKRFDIRGEWEDALKEVRVINGLVFREDENEVDFRDKVVKGICCLLNQIKNENDVHFKDKIVKAICLLLKQIIVPIP